MLSPSKVAIELRTARLAVQGAMGAYRLQRRSPLRQAARSPHGKPIFVLCLPKSASTFFSHAVALATGRTNVLSMPVYGRREQEFDALATLAVRDRAVVLQSHTRFSVATRFFLAQAGTPPVLLVRNLYDSLISLWDHLLYEETDVPVALVAPHDLDREDAEMLDFLIDIVAPWYVQFFAGWMRAAESEVDLLVLDYEAVTADTAGAIESVCRHVGDPMPTTQVMSRALETARNVKVRFNQGTTGRGASFGEERRARVERLAAFYPDVDFSPIGIARQLST
jgi:hypothetical protein